MAKFLYICSKPGGDSQLILSERPPIILHLDAKLRAASLDGGLDLCSPEAAPTAGNFEWESFLYDDPCDPTGLRLVLKRVSGPRSAREAASCSSLPRQATCHVPHTADRAGPKLKDSPVMVTENKTSTPNWDHWIRASVNPDTSSKNKRGGIVITPSDTASCSSSRSSYKRAASEMDNEEFTSPSKRSCIDFFSSSSCCTDEEM